MVIKSIGSESLFLINESDYITPLLSAATFPEGRNGCFEFLKLWHLRTKGEKQVRCKLGLAGQNPESKA